MLTYTKKEIEDLKKSLFYIEESIEQDYSDPYSKTIVKKSIEYSYVNKNKNQIALLCGIKIKKGELFIRVRYLFSVIHNSKRKNGEDSPILRKIHKFLFKTEFKDIALFINDLPDFASWRLRIGK